MKFLPEDKGGIFLFELNIIGFNTFFILHSLAFVSRVEKMNKLLKRKISVVNICLVVVLTE